MFNKPDTLFFFLLRTSKIKLWPNVFLFLFFFWPFQAQKVFILFLKVLKFSMFSDENIFNLNTFSIVCFMFQYHNGLLPSPFLNIFLKNSDIHQYNTRSSHCYRSHTCRTNIKQFTILYNGPKIWNSLPKHITNISSYSLFKKHLFSYLCDISY